MNNRRAAGAGGKRKQGKSPRKGRRAHPTRLRSDALAKRVSPELASKTDTPDGPSNGSSGFDFAFHWNRRSSSQDTRTSGRKGPWIALVVAILGFAAAALKFGAVELQHHDTNPTVVRQVVTTPTPAVGSSATTAKVGSK